MSWNIEKMQARFRRKQTEIEIDLKGMQRKTAGSSFYKRLHDNRLGEQEVFIILEVTAALESREKLLDYLNTLRKDGPSQIPSGAFNKESVKDGWNASIDSLIAEFAAQ